MKQLDRRVSKLEGMLSGRPPRLAGKSAQECLELFIAACQSDPDRGDLVLQAMSDEQLEEGYEMVAAKLACRRAFSD